MNLEGKIVSIKSDNNDNKVFKIENNKKRLIISPQVFRELGLSSSDIQFVHYETISNIPEGEPITEVKKNYEFIERDKVRYEITRSYLKPGMKGIEIGAGAYPSILPDGVYCEYFDKRSEKELAEYFATQETNITKVKSFELFNSFFPEGADFIIAHNVLEHTPNPIHTLIEWNRLLKINGIAVISIPDHMKCRGDSDRLLPDFEHILLDFLLDRNDNSFESREHIYSGSIGWVDSYPKEIDKITYAKAIMKSAKADKPEHHWHALDYKLFEKIVFAADYFGEKSVKILTKATPYDENKINLNFGDDIIIYSILNQRQKIYDSIFLKELKNIKYKLQNAVNKI